MVSGTPAGRLSGGPGKTLCVLALLCRALFPLAAPALSAQARPGLSIFIPQVTGTGSGPEDPGFFTQMLAMEVAARNYQLAETRPGSQYSMNGSLSPFILEYDDGEPEEPRYVLHLALEENATSVAVVEQELVYALPEDTYEVLPLLVFTMLANIPPPPEPEPAGISDDWRQKWWYGGAFACWTPRVYTGTYQSANIANFSFGLATEIQFLNFMSFETGVELAQDWVVVSPDDDVEYRGHILEIPALLKAVLKPAAYFMIEPYAGIHLNIPLNDLTAPPLFSWTAGAQYGVKAGPGAVFVDARFVMDTGDSTVTMKPGGEPYLYQRYTVKLAAGYKIGVFPRKKRRADWKAGVHTITFTEGNTD
jgi:hypothetical protein